MSISLNGGIDYTEVPFPYVAYESNPADISLSQSLLSGMGMCRVRVSTSTSASELQSGAASEAKEEGEEDAGALENSAGGQEEGGGEEDEQQAEEGKEENNAGVQDAMTNFGQLQIEGEMNTTTGNGGQQNASSWLFSSDDAKLRVRAVSGASFDTSMPLRFDPESASMECEIPQVESFAAWEGAMKSYLAKADDAEPVEDPEAEEAAEEMPSQPAPLMCTAELALDGVNFEPIGEVSIHAAPQIVRIDPAAGIDPETVVTIYGHGFGGIDNASFLVEAMHVNSAQDWQVQGTVVENDDETGLERVEFCLGENMPKLSEDLSDEDEERAVVLRGITDWKLLHDMVQQNQHCLKCSRVKERPDYLMEEKRAELSEVGLHEKRFLTIIIKIINNPACTFPFTFTFSSFARHGTQTFCGMRGSASFAFVILLNLRKSFFATLPELSTTKPMTTRTTPRKEIKESVPLPRSMSTRIPTGMTSIVPVDMSNGDDIATPAKKARLNACHSVRKSYRSACMHKKRKGAHWERIMAGNSVVGDLPCP